MTEILLVMIIVHLLGDFYFQSRKMSLEKKDKISSLIIHGGIYLFITLLPFIRYNFNIYVLIIGMVIGISHFLIDLLLFYIKKIQKFSACEDKFFIIDQIIHIAIIIITVKLFNNNLNDINYQSLLGVDFGVLQWIAALLFAGKPANIAFKKLFNKYRPTPENISQDNDKDSGQKVKNSSRQYAGAIIGILERILTLILISVYAYAGIGLILTAKSIARYDKISKNPQFAEYYLIGTLSSILFMIGAYLAIFVLL
ncbi:MAG: DUF3307 domain-containing protein [Clostridia bacterium]|nr:DUF3307 domain-containing protein [Clostridia bacterium]